MPYGFVEVKHHAISSNQDAIMLSTDFRKGVVFNTCIIPKQSRNLVDQDSLYFSCLNPFN